eukprot:g4615.t1
MGAARLALLSVLLLASAASAWNLGMMTWNTADMEQKVIAGADAQAVFQEGYKAMGDVDVVAVALQENYACNCGGAKSPAEFQTAVKAGKLSGYEVVGQYWRYTNCIKAGKINMHGSSGVIVFAKKAFKTKHVKTAGAFSSGYKMFGNNEKGVAAVWFEDQMGKIHCFGGSHLNTGDNLAATDRLDSFNKYQGFFADFKSRTIKNKAAKPPSKYSCDYSFYGGDFNWRNGEWGGKTASPHFAADDVKKFFKNHLTVGFQNSVGSSLTVPPTLLAKDERTKRAAGWTEGACTTAKENPKTFPSFQPLASDQCDKLPAPATTGETTSEINASDDNDPGDKNPATISAQDKEDGKEPKATKTSKMVEGTLGDKTAPKKKTAFLEEGEAQQGALRGRALSALEAEAGGAKIFSCLAVKSGTNMKNCPKAAGKFCFTGNRPLAYTDSIFHKGDGATATKYGPLLMPVPSDHFPVVGVYRIKENQD